MENTPAENNIQIRDTFSGAEYANIMNVGHTKEEFLLTFMNVVPPGGRVVAKVITSPGHMKRILNALNENVKKYEATFGPIAAAETPQSEIGFKAD